MRFGGVARQASRAADLHENAVMRVLEGGPHLPNLETLDKMANAYGWELGTVAYWALNRQPPAASDGEPERIIAQQLVRLRYPEARRRLILDLLAEWRPELPSSE